MKQADRESMVRAVARMAANPIGSLHYIGAVAVTVPLVLLSESIYQRWPMFTLTLLASAAAFLGSAAVAYQTVSARLLGAVVPLQREAARLQAALKVSEHRGDNAEAERDRWKSAVEQAAGGPAGGTPTDLIARQALRIRTLERALDHGSDSGTHGNGGGTS